MRKQVRNHNNRYKNQMLVKNQKNPKIKFI